MKSKLELKFHLPSLKLSVAGRLTFRIVSYISYIILIAAAVSLLSSDVSQLFWLGVFITLFLVDRLLHKNLAEFNVLFARGPSVNVGLYLTPRALRSLEQAQDKSLVSGGDFSLHLFSIILDRREVSEIFSRLEIKKSELQSALLKSLSTSRESKKSSTKKEIISTIESLVKSSFEDVRHRREAMIGVGDLLINLLEMNRPDLNRLLSLFSLTPSDFRQTLVWNYATRLLGPLKRLPASIGGFAHHPLHVSPRTINRAWTSRPTPTLDRYSLDLTALARQEKVGLLIGHNHEYENLEDILSKPSQPNAVLVGPPGSGKKTILAHLAFRIIKDQVPGNLFDRRQVSLNLSSLVAGARPEVVQSRVEAIVNEIVSAGNIIIILNNLNNLVQKNEGSLSIADAILPVIENGLFPVIGLTSPSGWHELETHSPDFASSFSPVTVDPISPEDATSVLAFESVVLENQYRQRLIITLTAIRAAVRLATRHFASDPLPGSALRLLKEAAADVYQSRGRLVNRTAIITIAERKVNVPLENISEPDAKRLLNLESFIHERLIDQSEAVSAVSASLRRYRSGLTENDGPIASFLFVGPTGVGKTELSKILAELEFGSRQEMIRLDMSEYQDKSSLVRLLGSPNGKIIGTLTEAVIAKPYSLILLDEFEKSHPDILNIFLQVLADGRLTGGDGITVNFNNTLLIATSNAHSEYIKNGLDAGLPVADIEDNLKSKLTSFFKPELLNRFSKIIVFKPLSQTDISAIAKIKVNRLIQEIKERKSITLKVSAEALAEISSQGYDPSFGARPLDGVINERLKDKLAEAILKRDLLPGSEVLIDFQENLFTFSAKN